MAPSSEEGGSQAPPLRKRLSLPTDAGSGATEGTLGQLDAPRDRVEDPGYQPTDEREATSKVRSVTEPHSIRAEWREGILPPASIEVQRRAEEGPDDCMRPSKHARRKR